MANKDLSSFLATDKVPESLFGIPVVASPKQYTESDIAFFQEHPKAGGFYELGEGDEVIEQAGLGVEGTTNTEGTADSFELHKSWSSLSPEQQDMNRRILRRVRDFATHDQNYFQKHGDTLGTYYSEAVGVDALKKIGMQFAPGSWKGVPKCNLLVHNVLESVKRGIAPRFGDGGTGYPWTARSWRVKVPPGFVKVENIDDRVPGDIVVGEVLREDGKLDKHAHIGFVAEDRVSSYAAKWDEGAKRYPFPFSDTTSKGKTIKWDPKYTTIIRYIGTPKKRVKHDKQK